MIDLFSDFLEVVRNLTATELDHPEWVNRLELATDPLNTRQNVRMAYAPFDYVNTSAKIVIVGITPGRQQASNALKAAKLAVERGASAGDAAKAAKVFASFSGAMRSNLVQMLDSVGIARWLGIGSTAALWEERSDLVHFTSAIRYPVFVNGADWSGSNPAALRSREMRKWLLAYTGTELNKLPGAAIIPLGPKVTEMVEFFASEGLISQDRILTGLPHPSGANAERIAYFLQRKPKELLSPKTNAETLDRARAAVTARVKAFG